MKLHKYIGLIQRDEYIAKMVSAMGRSPCLIGVWFVLLSYCFNFLVLNFSDEASGLYPHKLETLLEQKIGTDDFPLMLKFENINAPSNAPLHGKRKEPEASTASASKNPASLQSFNAFSRYLLSRNKDGSASPATDMSMPSDASNVNSPSVMEPRPPENSAGVEEDDISDSKEKSDFAKQYANINVTDDTMMKSIAAHVRKVCEPVMGKKPRTLWKMLTVSQQNMLVKEGCKSIGINLTPQQEKEFISNVKNIDWSEPPFSHAIYEAFKFCMVLFFVLC